MFQAFLGIVALANHEVYIVGPHQLAAFNYTAWGWIHIALGVVLLTAAGSVFSGRFWGRLIGSVMVGLSLFSNLAFLPAYPVWGLTLVVIDILMLYSLLVRGGETRS